MIERYTRPALAELWSDARRYETWLRVELAACEAMEAAGRVPAGTAESVRQRTAGKLQAKRIWKSKNRPSTTSSRFSAMSRNWRVSRRAGCTWG